MRVLLIEDEEQTINSISKIIFASLFFLMSFLINNTVQAQKIYVLRDNEIENALRAFGHSVIEASELDVSEISFHILSDMRPNAFVTQDRKIFITLGLLRLAKNPGEITGVIGHEAGHILERHIARRGQKDFSKNIVLATILLSSLSGQEEAISGSFVGINALNDFYRGEGRADEQAADQIAVDLMKKINVSPIHLANMTENLLEKEKGLDISVYTQTHPLSQDRLIFLLQQEKKFIGRDQGKDAEQSFLLKRIQARIAGSFDSSKALFSRYPKKNTDFISDYAHLAFYQREDQFEKAEAKLSTLIKENPKDPFLYEIKGDVLRNQGKLLDASESYQQAIEITPWSGLLRLSRADVLFLEAERIDDNVEQKKWLTQAEKEVRSGLDLEKNNLYGWELLAKIEERTGDAGERDLALAEAAWLRGHASLVRKLSERAYHLLKDKNRIGALRAKDLQIAAEAFGK